MYYSLTSDIQYVIIKMYYNNLFSIALRYGDTFIKCTHKHRVFYYSINYYRLTI